MAPNTEKRVESTHIIVVTQRAEHAAFHVKLPGANSYHSCYSTKKKSNCTKLSGKVNSYHSCYNAGKVSETPK
ncbi:MAG: hypothetical protein QMD22_05165, partial [archaeon]|nr:hypothetical protein [archaeon]